MGEIKPATLGWDSDFFGYPVGKIEIESWRDNELNNTNYKLVYVFSKILIPQFENSLKDKKVVYSIDLKNQTTNDDVQIQIIKFDSLAHSYEQLLSLTLESGIFSRFFIDKEFNNDEYSKLYKRWLDNSLNSSSKYEVFVAVENEELLGFITLGIKEDDLLDIGLLAVNPKFRGRKIGTHLMNFSKIFAKSKNISHIQVVTQFDNTPACKLYEKAGFTQTDLTYIYHIWNHDTI